MAVGAFYGRQVFNPYLVVFQITLLQAIFYFGYVFMLLLADRASGVEVQVLDQMFLYKLLTMNSLSGVVSSAALLFNSVIFVCGATVIVVGRARKCLDFIGTVFIIHLVLCSMYGGFPWRLTWWVLNSCALSLTTLLSEYICMRMEMREIPLSGIPVEFSSVSVQS